MNFLHGCCSVSCWIDGFLDGLHLYMLYRYCGTPCLVDSDWTFPINWTSSQDNTALAGGWQDGKFTLLSPIDVAGRAITSAELNKTTLYKE